MTERYGGKRFLRGLIHFLLGKAFSALSGFLAMVLVVRLLSIQEFANYSVLVSLVELFTAFSALGLSHALLRYVPELYAMHYKIALKEFIFGAFLIRSTILLFAIGLTFYCTSFLAPLIGLKDCLHIFKIFLIVIIFRTTLYFVSQILESTLHQGLAQFAFTLSTLARLVGMLYLMNLKIGGLLQVIYVELISDGLGLLIMIISVVQVIMKTTQEKSSPDDDNEWIKINLRKIVNFALAGYVQHIVGLPFGSNTNRLVGGVLFSNSVMASFGFAQTLYDYFKRYLPAQLLVGLIRPVVVARFIKTNNFNKAAKTCEHVALLNMALIGGMIVALTVGGYESLMWVSAGKYGYDSLILLLVLLVVLSLETYRLILEILVQTVSRYTILIPSNILLSLSIIPAILMFPYFGSVGFPISNAVVLIFSNFWVKRQLLNEGYIVTSDWSVTTRLFIIMITTSLIGNILNHFGVYWVVSTAVAELSFLFGTWTVCRNDLLAFISDLTSDNKQLV